MKNFIVLLTLFIFFGSTNSFAFEKDEQTCQCEGRIKRICKCIVCKCKTVYLRKVTVLYFSSKNCVFCKKVEKKVFPELVSQGWELDSDNPHFIIYKDDALKNEEFDIEALPTFIYMVDGKEVDRDVGYRTASELGNKINSIAKK